MGNTYLPGSKADVQSFRDHVDGEVVVEENLWCEDAIYG